MNLLDTIDACDNQRLLLAIANDPSIACAHDDTTECPLCQARAILATRALRPEQQPPPPPLILEHPSYFMPYDITFKTTG